MNRNGFDATHPVTVDNVVILFMRRRVEFSVLFSFDLYDFGRVVTLSAAISFLDTFSAGPSLLLCRKVVFVHNNTTITSDNTQKKKSYLLRDLYCVQLNNFCQ